MKHHQARKVAHQTTLTGQTTEIYRNQRSHTELKLNNRPEVKFWGIWSAVVYLVIGTGMFARPDLEHGADKVYDWVLGMVGQQGWGLVFIAISAFLLSGLFLHRAALLRTGLAAQMFVQFVWGLSLAVTTWSKHDPAFLAPLQWWTGSLICAFLLRGPFFNRAAV